MEKTRPIGKEIRSLSNLIMRRFDSARPDKEALERITGTNRWLIGYLTEKREKGQDVYQRDLEAAFGVTRSTVSKVLELMERKGLVERSPVAHDARLRKLTLTDKALELSQRMRAYAEGVEREITAGFSAQELDTLFSYLRRIRQNLGE